MGTPSSQSQTIPCDIVLLPSTEQSQRACAASQQLGQQGALFTLDDRGYFAHASLYMFQMNVAAQERCVAALQEIAAQTKAQRLKQNGYFYIDSTPDKGYVDVQFTRNAAVDSLQDRVVNVFNVLRAPMHESDRQKMTDATGLKLENLKKYGYPAIGELFRPHITLTRFPMETEPDLSVLPSPEIFSGEFPRIGLFEMGPHGTSIRKIAEFELS